MGTQLRQFAAGQDTRRITPIRSRKKATNLSINIFSPPKRVKNLSSIDASHLNAASASSESGLSPLATHEKGHSFGSKGHSKALKDKTPVIVPPRWTGNDGDGLLELKTFYMTQYLKLIKERELIGREVEVSSERSPPNFDSQMHPNSLMEQLAEVERQLDDLESEASLSIWG